MRSQLAALSLLILSVFMAVGPAAAGQRYEFITTDLEAVIVLATGAPTSGVVPAAWIESFSVRSPGSPLLDQTSPACRQSKFPPYTNYDPVSLELSADGERIVAFTHERYQHYGDSVPLEPPVRGAGWIYGYTIAFTCAGEIQPTQVTFFSTSYSGTWARVSPVCDIQLNQPSYQNGETITAQVFRLANPGSEPVSVEIKFWLEIPRIDPISLANQGADGSVVLPPGFDQDLGPMLLATIEPGHPRGVWAWNCRLLNPVTGETSSTDINTFDIQ